MGLLNRIKKNKYEKIIDETITEVYKKDEYAIKRAAQVCKEVGFSEEQTSIVLNTALSGSTRNISKAQIEDVHIEKMNQIMIEQSKEFYAMTPNLLITPEYHFNNVLKNDMLRYVSYLYAGNVYDRGFGEFMIRVFNDIFESDGVIYSLKDIDKCLVTCDLTNIFQGRNFTSEGPAKLNRFASTVPFGIIQINTLRLIQNDNTINAEDILKVYLMFQMILTQIGESYSTIYSTFYTCVNNYNHYILDYVPDNKNTEDFINYCKRINATMHKYEKS